MDWETKEDTSHDETDPDNNETPDLGENASNETPGLKENTKDNEPDDYLQ